MIDRAELDQWLREHDYALVTREQAARMERAVEGVVPWDEHRRALAKADAELAAARAAIERVRALHQPIMDEDEGGNRFADGCMECHSDDWPCPTLEALAAVSAPVPHPDPIDHS